MSRIGKSTETEYGFLVATGWGKEEQGVTVNEDEIYFEGDKNVVELNSSDGCTTL